MTSMERREGWFKSSFSGPNGGSCVEVRFLPGGTVAVRDTKDRSQPALVFTTGEWVAFLAGARAGEFDLAQH
jgi:hypothetical protein